MKTKAEKQNQRFENKKKKLAAFLEIVKLNDKDREEKQLKLRPTDSESTDSDQANMSKTASSSGESQKKRMKMHHSECTVEVLEPVKPIEQQLESHKVGPSGKVQLQGEEYLRLKNELRDRKKRLSKQPLFRLRFEGEKACVDVKEADRTPLFFSDIQHLLLYSLIGNHAPYSPFAWCQFEKHNCISHTVVLVLEGLSLYDYLAFESCFPSIAANFTTKLEIITPSAYNGNFVEELALIPMTHTKELTMIKRYGSLEAVLRADGNVFRILRSIFPILETDETPSVETSHGKQDAVPWKAGPRIHESDRFPRTQLIMSPSQLIDENFPVPLKGPLKAKYADYLMTKDLYREVTPQSPMFALDCEMCMTSTGVLELTRISIVDENLKCLYDELVLPYNRITNYLTRYSGITRQMMEGVTKRLEDVQDDIRHLLPMDAILVGQSLNSDLHTLKMMHPYVIDTSVIFNVTSDYRRKTKLSTLSLRFLGEKIQTGQAGHCPTEDSEACMKLVQLKLANSLAFGDTILASYLPEFRSKTHKFDSGLRFIKFAQTEMERRASVDNSLSSQTVSQYHTQPKPGSENEGHLATLMFSYLERDKKSVGIVGTENLQQEYSRWNDACRNATSSETLTPIDVLPASSESDVYDRVISASKKHSFTIGHLRYKEQDMTEAPDKEARFMDVDSGCRKVWEALALNGLCVVVFGGRRGGANGACFIQFKKSNVR